MFDLNKKSLMARWVYGSKKWTERNLKKCGGMGGVK